MKESMRGRNILRTHGMSIGVVGAIVLAWFVPGPVAQGGALPWATVVWVGVFLIFLAQGWLVPWSAFRKAMGRWPVHGLMQGCIVLVAPSVMLLWLVGAETLVSVPSPARDGLLFLSLLPTTIASAVALTALAGGAVPLAMINSVASNLFAIVWVPLGALVLLGKTGDVDAGAGVLRVTCLVAFPVVSGALLRVRCGDILGRHRVGVRRFNTGVILLIVYTAFSETFASSEGFFLSERTLLVMAAGALCLLVVMSGLTWGAGRVMRFSPPERVALFYVGSQKSLATGAPLATALLGGVDPGWVGVVLVPLLLYHTAQLAVGGALVERWRTTTAPVEQSRQAPEEDH